MELLHMEYCQSSPPLRKTTVKTCLKPNAKEVNRVALSNFILANFGGYPC